MSNPLVDRILNFPLTFVPAKHPEKDLQPVQSAGYIVLSSKQSAPNKGMPEAEESRPTATQPKRPKSMAEAIAAYTGQKYASKAERKKAKKANEQKSETAKLPTDSSEDDTRYESASEFHTDSSFQGFQSESEDVGKSESEEVGKSASDDDAGGVDLDENESDGVSLHESESEGVNLDEHESENSEDDEDDEDFEDHTEELANDLDTETSASRETQSADEDEGESLSQLRKDLMDDNQAARESEESLANLQPETQALTQTPDDATAQTPSTRWPKALQKKKPVGLINFGVTCYMNSAIQIMIHIPAVQQYLYEVTQNKHKQISPKSVTHVLAELSSKMWGLDGGSKKYINPKKIVQRLEDINCMMSEWQQEDSHEYFMSLMSRLQEDSTPKGKKLNESELYNIFGGLLEQEVVCQECKAVSVTEQEFYDLSLGLNKKRRASDDHEQASEASGNRYSVSKSLRDFFNLETIRADKNDRSSGYFCEKCNKRTIATKKSAIKRSPETLMVHMKRFKFNGNQSLKVKQPVHYDKFLDLSTFSKNKGELKYQLMGVIVHEGRLILSGHYIAHCLQPDGSWATYDDEYINKINEKSALTDQSAYCLIYLKTDTQGKKRGADESRPSAKRAKLSPK